MKKTELYMVFDVESVGLHGEGFAVGWVVVNEKGLERSHGLIWCPPDNARGEQKNREWVNANVPNLGIFQFLTPEQVRSEFWKQWLRWKAAGAELWADCLWPVEARFLIDCVNDMPGQREWEGPYPFHDIASLLVTRGIDPLTTFPRQDDEMPAHNPLNDARQSARILIHSQA